MAVTLIDPSGPVMAGDVITWDLPAADPQPRAGATLGGEGSDEHGELRRLWWQVAYRPESGIWPRPTHVVRGYVPDDGAGSAVPVTPNVVATGSILQGPTLASWALEPDTEDGVLDGAATPTDREDPTDA